MDNCLIVVALGGFVLGQSVLVFFSHVHVVCASDSSEYICVLFPSLLDGLPSRLVGILIYVCIYAPHFRVAFLFLSVVVFVH